MAERAPIYRQQAQKAGRAVVAEFVLEWLVREQQWRRDPEHRVVVVFADDPPPQTAAGRPAAASGFNDTLPEARPFRHLI